MTEHYGTFKMPQSNEEFEASIERGREGFRELGRKMARRYNDWAWGVMMAAIDGPEPPSLHPIDPFDTSNEVKATK